MARTYRTARKSTAGPSARLARVVPPAPAQPAPQSPEIEEDPDELYFFEENAEGDIMPVDHGDDQEARARVAQLEAQLAGRQAPMEFPDAVCPISSPPRKRVRYGDAGPSTGH